MATDTCCFLDQVHQVFVFEIGPTCAVTFSGSEYGLPLESISSTIMCVEWLTVADVRPGPLT